MNLLMFLLINLVSLTNFVNSTEPEFPVITVMKEIKCSQNCSRNETDLWENFISLIEIPWSTEFVSNSTKYLEDEGKVFQMDEFDSLYKFKLCCEAKCPVQWKFQPASAKEKISEDLIYSFNVSTRRTASDVLDEATFKYEANLTIGGHSNALTGTYACECVDTNISSYIFIYWIGSKDENILLNVGENGNIMKPDDYPNPWIGIDCTVSNLSKSEDIKLFKFKGYPRPKSLKRSDLGVYEQIKLNSSIVRDHESGFLLNIREIPHPFGQWACGKEIDAQGDDAYQTMIHLDVRRYEKFEGWPWWKNMKPEPIANISMRVNKLSSVSCCYDPDEILYIRRGMEKFLQTRIFYLRNEPTYSLVQPLIKKLRFNTFNMLDTNTLSGTCSSHAIQRDHRMFFRVVICTNEKMSKYFPMYPDLIGGVRNSTLAGQSADMAEDENSDLVKTNVEKISYFDGELANFSCEALSYSFSEGIYWIIQWRNGTKTQVMGERSVKMNTFASHFQERMDLDMVNVSCYAPEWKSSKWAISTVKNYTIYAASKPTIWVNTSQNLDLHLGEVDVNLNCTIETIAITTVEWWKTNATSGNKTLISRAHFNPFYNTSIIREVHKINFTENAIGNYTCRASNLKGSDELTFVVTHKAHEAPKVKGQTQIYENWTVGELNNSLDCTIYGDPLPRISWKKNNMSIQESENLIVEGNKLTISEVGLNTEGTYSCQATNAYGIAEKIFEVKISKPNANLMKTVSILGALTVILVFLCGGTFYLIISRQQKLKNKITMTENLINSFGGGIYFEENGQVIAKKVDYNYRTHEINKEFLIIGNAELGQGNFGVVRVGLLAEEYTIRKNLKHCLPVLKQKNVHLRAIAIKAPFLPKEEQTNSGEMMDSFGSIISELRTMAFIKERFGAHPNIVEFLGAYTANIINREVYVLVELCQKRNLKDHLIAHKTEFSQGFAHVLHQMAKWCSGIAAGLKFLEATNIVHIDISARNILLSSEGVPKISDFGQARILQKENIEYIKRTKQSIPYLWTSIEALKEDRFSAKSDVWSYGVTIWEIYSCGEFPKLLRLANQDLQVFIRLLEQGDRLPQPNLATNAIYSLMRSCWNAEPNLRPNVTSLKEFFDSLISPNFSECQDQIENSCDNMSSKANLLNQRQGLTVDQNALIPKPQALQLELLADLRICTPRDLVNPSTVAIQSQSYLNSKSPYLQSINLPEIDNNLSEPFKETS